MIETEIKQLVKSYIKAWSTTNSEERKELIGKLYSMSAKFYAHEPGDEPVEYSGIAEIYRHITQVNDRLVIDNALTTEETGYSENHNTLKVTWVMKDSDGNVVVGGMDFLQLDHSKKIKRDYIFIN